MSSVGHVWSSCQKQRLLVALDEHTTGAQLARHHKCISLSRVEPKGAANIH